MGSAPDLHTDLFASPELLTQPWLPDLTRMINESYLVSPTDKIEFRDDKLRLRSNDQLSRELGPEGFTAVAFTIDGVDEKPTIVGTASMKKWKDDGLWQPWIHNEPKLIEEKCNGQVDHILGKDVCPGDYELAVVAIPPNPQYRGKGIASKLVKLCEEEVLRQHEGHGDSSPIRIMIRVVKENAGDYWQRQGFTAIASQRCPKGFWDAAEEFTMWAMIRELSPR